MKIGVNAQVIYERNTKKLYICNVNSSSPLKKIEGKYGIEVYYDIYGKLTSICIPEPDVLIGIDEELFESFI